MKLPDPGEELGAAETMKAEVATTAAMKLEKRMMQRECEVGLMKEFFRGDDGGCDVCERRKTIYIPHEETATTAQAWVHSISVVIGIFNVVLGNGRFAEE